MGNTCEIDQNCCQPETRTLFRKQKLKPLLFSQIGSKDLVQIKKYLISTDYTVLSPAIGKGSFGSVYKIINKQSGLAWATKRIPKTHSMEKHVQQILILKQLDHPNIIRIIDVYEEDTFIYVVMEMCNGGQLFDRIVERANINQGVVREYMQQLLSAIAYCHMNRVIHRDLKPENIMLVSPQQDNIKIIDFGASTMFKKGEINSVKVGSVYYIAPEVIKKNYTEKCDMWSIGVIFFMMLSGTPPFNGKTDKQIFQKILLGQFSFNEKNWKHISEQAKDLITKLLQKDADKRLSARQALSHPWMLKKKQSEKSISLFHELSSIKQFCAMTKFKQNIMAYITHNLTTAEGIGKMKSYFETIDINGDGRISWRQFEQCYKQNMFPVSHEELKEIFKKLDSNSSGFIDYSQFLTSTLTNQLMSSKPIIEKAFDMIDKDKDGFLDKGQVMQAMGGAEESLYEQMLQQCDTNNDGLISRQQFMTVMMNISHLRIKNTILPNTTRVTTKISN